MTTSHIGTPSHVSTLRSSSYQAFTPTASGSQANHNLAANEHPVMMPGEVTAALASVNQGPFYIVLRGREPGVFTDWRVISQWSDIIQLTWI